MAMGQEPTPWALKCVEKTKGVATFVSVLALPTAVTWGFSQLPVVPSGILVFVFFFLRGQCVFSMQC